MKNLIKIFSLIGVAAVLMTACEPNDINSVNPNQFSDASPELMITGAQLANVLVQEGELARMGGIFAGYFRGSDRQYISVDQYNVVAGDLDNIWGTLYAEGIAQSRIIQEKAEAKNDMVLKASPKSTKHSFYWLQLHFGATYLIPRRAMWKISPIRRMTIKRMFMLPQLLC